LASGYIHHADSWASEFIRSFHRSKDAIVNLWTVPLDKNDEAAKSKPPMSLGHHFRGPDQGDLTSLDWNFDGSLLAIGSYDSILRVCTVSGALYFSSTKHRVSLSVLGTYRTEFMIWENRGQYLPRDFRNPVVGS
jgi:WD40 repeat protein